VCKRIMTVSLPFMQKNGFEVKGYHYHACMQILYISY
jgi:hypothetical protein